MKKSQGELLKKKKKEKTRNKFHNDYTTIWACATVFMEPHDDVLICLRR